jgi:hypothetical protein
MATLELIRNEIVMVDVQTEELGPPSPSNQAVIEAESRKAAESAVDAGIAPEVVDEFWKEPITGEIASSEMIYRPASLIAAAAPSVSDCSLTTTCKMEASGGISLKLTLFGPSVSTSAKYTISRDFKLVCKSGESKIVCILIPFIHEVRMWQPEGADEKFPINSYRLIPRLSQLGAQQIDSDAETVLRGAGEHIPVQSDSGGMTTSESRTIELSGELNIGLGDAEKLGFGVKLEASGSAQVDTEVEVPKGQFTLYWLRRPAGAALVKRS